MIGAALLLTTAAHAQNESSASKQLWIDYDPSLWVSEKVELYGDLGLRWELKEDGFWRLVVRPGVRVPVGAFRLTGGIGNFFTLNDSISDRWEIRPFQGVSTVWPNWLISFNHYLRLEERIDFDTETWTALTSLRARYRLRATYRFAALQKDKYWTLTASGEGFVTVAGEQGQQREQVRLTAGIERSMQDTRRFRFEISWQQQELFFLPSENVDDIFFRFRVYHGW
jgi:hypothetical protein